MNDRRRCLAGRYELGPILGRGGMGTVHRATDLALDRTVAVKLLPAAVAEEDPRQITRFEREARAAASLSHEAVVVVYDAGEDEATRFIVMECVEGRSLSEVLRDDAPLTALRAADIASSVAGALAAAHGAGIVHRDIKPGNVMLSGDGAVKVLDFGIARSLTASTLTQSASVLGTAAYMAPEQALGERADERSDIYALGCLLYAMLTGSPPFTGDSVAAVLAQQANSEPRAPSSHNGAVPSQLDTLVLQMLAKSPEDRPHSAAEVRRRLAELATATPPTAATAPLRPASTPAPPLRRSDRRPTGTTRVLASDARKGPGRARRRAGAGAALVAGIALLAAVVALAVGGGSTRHAAVPATARSKSAPDASRVRPAGAGAPKRTSPKAAQQATRGATTSELPRTRPGDKGPPRGHGAERHGKGAGHGGRDAGD